MNWYEVMPRDNTVKDPLVADVAQLGAFSEEDFRRGKIIDGWKESATLRATQPGNDGDPDDVLLNDELLLVFSARLQTAILNAGMTGVQFLPIRVLRPNGSSIPGYAIANILNIVAALDERRSTFYRNAEDFPIPELRGQPCIIKAALIGSKLVGYDLFRLAESPILLFASERFRKLFIESHFTGMSFMKRRVS